MASTTLTAQAAHHDGTGAPSHHPPASLYYIVYLILMGLLVLTVGLYYVDLQRFIPIPGINLIVALMVAVVKAALVVLFFMNVKNSSKLTWLWAGIGFAWLFLMGGIIMDYVSRSWNEVPGWQ